MYVLTSARTFSGAEEFSYNLQNLKRATIIGETTGGGAHPTNAMIVQHDFILRVPFARAINPVSKTNWEGTGVKPDIACPAAEAFDKAYALAVEKLAAKATDPQAKGEFEWILAGQKAKGDPARVDEKTLKTYAGVYGERQVTFENGALFYQRTGPKYRLIPMTATLFALDGLETFRIEFTVKDGKTVGLVGFYDNGEPRRLAADEVGAVRPRAAGTPAKDLEAEEDRGGDGRDDGAVAVELEHELLACRPEQRQHGQEGRERQQEPGEDEEPEGPKLDPGGRDAHLPRIEEREAQAGRLRHRDEMPALEDDQDGQRRPRRAAGHDMADEGEAEQPAGDEDPEDEAARREVEEARVEPDVEPSLQDGPSPERQPLDVFPPGPGRRLPRHLDGPEDRARPGIS